MARMHARKKGKSSSRKPFVTENPKWVPLSKKEITEKVVELHGKGYPSAVIGLILRDQYGVPSVKLATGRKITDILKEAGIETEIPEDLFFLMKKAVRLHEHLAGKGKDLHNKRGLTLVESKIRRLVKYYKRTGVLPDNWTYSQKTAKLLVK